MYILDCTLRDGGYINNWRFNKRFIDMHLSILNDIVEYVEIGFINKSKNYKNHLVGDCRNLTKSIINSYNDYNFKKVVMADYKDVNIDLLKENIDVDLVRIAFHKIDLYEALNICKDIKKLGYKVSVNAMAITNYSIDELEYLFNFINEHSLDILYVADSYGSLHQTDIEYYLNKFNEKLHKSCLIGFHLHNNMNNAYSNYEYLKKISESMEREIIIDGTIFGMGRGAGNLQTELVILDQKINDIDKIIEILLYIQNYIKPIYGQSERNWGYDLDYLLSGYLKMHPNYVVKMRDLNISMNNRLFLIKEMVKEDIKYNYFNIDIINIFINKHKEYLL